MDELQKYIVAGMVSEELMSEQSNAFTVLNEDGMVIPTNQGGSPRMPASAIHRLVAESLVECSPLGCYPTGSNGQQPKADPKIEKTRQMVQVISDMLYRVGNTFYGDDDESIKKTVQDACNPLIRIMIQKLYDLWVLNNAQQPEQQDDQKQGEAKQPVQPNASAVTVTPDVVGKEGLQLNFAPAESITSPQNIEYIIESIEGDILRLKEKATGKRATVSKAIAKKWIYRKGA